MPNRLTKMKSLIYLVLFILIVCFAGYAQAQTSISGKITMAYTKMDTLSVEDTEGHAMMMGESKGTNTCTSGNDIMDNAEAVNISYSDLIMGSGKHEGYVTFKKGDDMTVAKWQGEVKTVMTDEKTPKTTFSGKFKYIKGAGKFKGIEGSGTYNGHFTSNTEYTVDWEAKYTLK